MDLTEKLTGYIVNVWNPLNFQIHLDREIDDVYYDTYYYQENNIEKQGKYYRCRLRNVRLRVQNENEKYNEIMTEIMRKIYLSNGWVIVKIHYIDKYKRLIVDLFDPITLENYYDLLTVPKFQHIIEKY